MLTDDEADEIRLGLAAGLRGPILIKWVRVLLEDRAERRALERSRQRRPWPGPLAGPALFFPLDVGPSRRDDPGRA